MAAYEVLLLNTAVPQIQAAQAGDTYVVPRDIAFSAALTLSAGTANGVPYLNGSKVLTSGSALTFDGTNFGIGGSASFKLDVISSSDVAGAIRSTGSSNSASLILSNGNGTTSANYSYIRYFNNSASPQEWRVGTYGDARFVWQNITAGSEAMCLTSTGLGIGTSSPGYKLDVFAGATNSAVAQLTGNNTGRGLKVSTAQTTFADDTVVLDAQMATYGVLQLATGGTTRATLDSSGNLGLGGSAQRATTVGTAALNIFNGTAPVGTLANGISLYSSSGEAYVMDAAGNATLFSPHDAETNEWIFKSKHTPSGKVLRIDVERLLRFVNDHFGLDAVKEFVEE